MIFNRKFAYALGFTTVLGTSGISPTAFADTASTPASSTTQTTAQTQSVSALQTKKLNLSPIFIQLSDVMGAIKAGDTAKAKADLSQIQSDFNAIEAKNSPLGQKTSQAIAAAIANPTNDTLNQLSSDLYAFEKEQNPVDVNAQRHAFTKKITPAFDQLNTAVNATVAKPSEQTIAGLRQSYQHFVGVWTANEKIVKTTSMGHYGKIETAVALIRVALETPTAGQPINLTQVKTQVINLQQALDSFNTGNTVAVEKVQGVTLATGIGLLQDGLTAFKSGDNATGQAKLGEFIRIWTSIEGDVSTRNPALYSKIESQVPVIMANGQAPKQQANLQNLINELNTINPTAQYTAIDSMLILLREGLEALLILMALLSALTAAKQYKGKKYVYAGVVTGLVASVLMALALQQFFPSMSAGKSREMLEGVIGIIAVVLMIGIGAWLHSKSSVKNWNAFIKRHMGEVLTTGSFVSLFGLSFLSVFREGAETLIFYMGILPSISTQNFLLGIGMALAVLAVTAFVMLKTSLKLPIPTLFKVLTWVIYFLGFKILGMSLYRLQLTGYLGRDMLPNLPVIEFIGFYPTLQTISAQALYMLAIVALSWWMKQDKKKQGEKKPLQTV